MLCPAPRAPFLQATVAELLTALAAAVSASALSYRSRRVRCVPCGRLQGPALLPSLPSSTAPVVLSVLSFGGAELFVAAVSVNVMLRAQRNKQKENEPSAAARSLEKEGRLANQALNSSGQVKTRSDNAMSLSPASLRAQQHV